MQVEDTQLFKVKAVARLFDVSPATVYREIEAGRLSALRIGSGTGSLRVPGTAVNAYMDRATVSAVRTGVAGSGQGAQPLADTAPADTLTASTVAGA